MEDQPTNSHTATNNNNASSITTSSSSSSRCSGSSTVASSTNSREKSNTASEPVRSRWTPKPEQILILESIFNSGMVNPPKEETVRIRKLLEKFGAVGDANVFYWFQNRRSRSRRRQRQLQASLAASAAATTITNNGNNSNLVSGGGLLDGGMQFYEFGNNNHNTTTCIATSPIVVTSLGTSGFSGEIVDDVFTTLSAQMGVISSHQLDSRNSSTTQTICPNDASHLEFPNGIITVFINGIATQVPEGPIDVKTMFGEDVLLVHSSGVPVPFNEYGITAQSLQHGESYFLVPRLT